MHDRCSVARHGGEVSCASGHRIGQCRRATHCDHAAGMPNFNNGCYGLVTRIATRAHPSALYRAHLQGLVIEAVPLNYNHDQFINEFDRQWPAGSAAAESYRARILRGTLDAPQSALLGGFDLGQTLCAMGAID